MKKIILTSLLSLLSASVFAEQPIIVKSELNDKSGRDALLVVYTEYVSTSDSIFCTNRNEDGRKFPKVQQRVTLVKSGKQLTSIESSFGYCNYQLMTMAIGITQPTIVKNLISMGANDVGDNTYSFKGGFSGLVYVEDAQTRDSLDCQFDSTSIVAKCNKEKIKSFSATSLDIIVNVK